MNYFKAIKREGACPMLGYRKDRNGREDSFCLPLAPFYEDF